MTAHGRDILERSAELRRSGRAHALATVVAVQRPTSARPGARGLVLPDGTIEGWVGGSCAQPVVVRECLRALADGEPRLLRLSREGASGALRGDGIIDEIMTCHSGGTLEIFVEPQLPSPELWVAGTTPIAGALVTLGAAMGFRVTLIDPVAEADAFPAAARVVADIDLGALDAPTSPWIVVATQGQWDEEACEAALARDAAYVGLVASPTRAAAVRAYLREQGLPAERIAALRAPSGLDLGATTAPEVAVSILAELVQVRRGRAAFVAAPGPATLAGSALPVQPARAGAPGAGHAPPDHAHAEHGHEEHGHAEHGHAEHGDPAASSHHGHHVIQGAGSPAAGEAIDPVCGMTVDVGHARHVAEHGAVIYYFCSVGCRTRFVREPGAYLSSTV